MRLNFYHSLKSNTLLLIFMFLTILGVRAQSGGSGSISDPYVISTSADLSWLAGNSGVWNSYFLQTADVSAAGISNPIGNSTTQFTGGYNGLGNTISGLSLSTTAGNQGLFGVSNGAVIKNLRVTGASVTGGSGVGILIGRADGPTNVSNVFVSGTVSSSATDASDAGGLVGYAVNIIVSNSGANVSVSAAGRNVGGFVGDANRGTYDNCYALGNVTSTGTRGQVGGFAGLCRTDAIRNSFARGNASQATPDDQGVGGFIGRMINTHAITPLIKNNYSTGSPSGGTNIGGFVGIIGAIGIDFNNNFFNMTTSGTFTAIGSGTASGTNPITGINTATMQTKSTFTTASWDFNTDWFITSTQNDGFPISQWAAESEGTITIVTGAGDSEENWTLNNGVLKPLQSNPAVSVSDIIGVITNPATVWDADNLTIEAPVDIIIDADIAPGASVDQSFYMKSGRDIVLRETHAINMGTNTINIIFWSDTNGDEAGGVLLDYTSSINAGFGNLWIGGGDGTALWNNIQVGDSYAVGLTNTEDSGTFGFPRSGINAVGTSINADNIYMSGKSTMPDYRFGIGTRIGGMNISGNELAIYGIGSENSNTSGDTNRGNWGVGIESANITMGTRDIFIQGIGGGQNSGTASGGGGNHGVLTNSTSSISTFGGDLTIIGIGGGNPSENANNDNDGLRLGGSLSVASGTISLTGTAGQHSNSEDIAYTSGIASGSGSADILLNANTLTLGVGTELVTLAGTLTIRPRTASTTLGIAGGAGTLSLPSNYFSTNFVDGFSSITIGSEDVGQVNIGSTALSYNDPLTIKTGNSIYFDPSANVSGNTNAITLWTRAGGNNSGSDNVPGATWMPEGSNLNTGGGNVIIGGGSDPTIGYAVGDNVGPSGENNARFRGVTINGTLAAGGGNISILGKGGNVSISNARGVSVGGAITTTGSGGIAITGIAHNSSDGFALGDGSITGPDGTISAVDGAITISGFRATGNVLNISTTGSTITSQGTTTLEARNDGKLNIDGSILGTGGIGSGNIVLISNDLDLGATSELSSQGTLTIRPLTATTSIGLGGATGEISLTADNFIDNIKDGFSNIIFGSATQSGNIAANTFIIRDNMTFLSTGNLALGGNLDLNGQVVTLGEDITLNESAGRFYGSTGELTTTRNLGALTAENVGGMGATITTSTALGNTTITRTHGQQSKGTANSILRSYNIVPATNTSLDATLVFNYVDAELNSLMETTLALHRSTDGGTNWSNQGGTIDDTGNTATLTGIDAFSLWTLFTGEFIWSADMSTDDGATDGNWDGGLAPPSGSNIVIPEGATPYPVFDFNFVAGNITIENNASLTIAPTRTLSFSTGSGASGAGKIILKSDETGDASIGDLTGAGSIGVAVTQERYMAGGNRAFRFFSHPYTTAVPLSVLADSIDVTGDGGTANGFTPTSTNAPSAFRFDPLNADGNEDNDGGWEAFTNMSQTIGQYEAIRILFRGSKGQANSLLDVGTYTPDPVTIEWEGTINQGTQDISLVGADQGGGIFSDWNLVGNPFPSAIDLSLVAGVTHSTGVLDYAVWQPRQSYTGEFSLIAGSGRGGAYLQVPSDVATVKIPSGGGFFIRAGGTTATLTIPEPAKTSVTPAEISNVLRMEDVPSRYGQNTLQIALEAENDFVDRVLVFLGNEYTPTRELQDAPKMANPLVNFFTVSEDDWALAIDRRPYVEQEGENRIPLHILAPNFKYTLSLPDFDIQEGSTLRLFDRFTEEYITLEKGTSYDFEVTEDPRTKGHRFDIVMGIEVITSINPTNRRFQAFLLPNPAQEQVRISIQKPDNTGDTRVRIVSMTGTEIRSEVLTTATSELDVNLSQLSKGVYLVEITHGRERIIKRLIVN